MDLKRAAEGLTVISIGLVLLANTLGTLPWSVWWNILSLWPLLIVAIGVDIIGKGADVKALRVLSSLIVIGGIAYGALVMPAGSGTPWAPFRWVDTLRESKSFDMSEPHDGSLKSGTATVRGGTGRLDIEAGRALATAEGNSPFDPRFAVRAEDGAADVEISLGEDGTWAFPGDTEDVWMSVTLDRRLVWSLTVESGVSRTRADLRQLPLESLTLKSGVSDSVVHLPKRSLNRAGGGLRVVVDAGVSTVTMRFAKGDDVRVRLTGGLSRFEHPDDLREVGRTDGRRTYQTRDFSGKRFWDVILNSGISTVNVEFY